MQDYYEELWDRLPDNCAGPDLARRRRFLEANVAPGERVLDLGCGTGEFTALLARRGTRPLGAEIAEAAVERCRRNHPALEFRLIGVSGPLAFEDNSFDVVWASEVIEHVADTARWLSEVRRVLVPRGRLLVSTPAHGRLRVALHGIERYSEPLGDHLHLYTRSSLSSTLKEFGFGEIEITAIGPPLMRRTLLARAVR